MAATVMKFHELLFNVCYPRCHRNVSTSNILVKLVILFFMQVGGLHHHHKHRSFVSPYGAWMGAIPTPDSHGSMDTSQIHQCGKQIDIHCFDWFRYTYTCQHYFGRWCSTGCQHWCTETVSWLNIRSELNPWFGKWTLMGSTHRWDIGLIWCRGHVLQLGMGWFYIEWMNGLVWIK